MKKKTYQQPEMKVAKIEQTDIICTSSGASTQSLDFDDIDNNGEADVWNNW